MGMGKTIMLSALIQSGGQAEEELEIENKPDPLRKTQMRLDQNFRPLPRVHSADRAPKATLIVAPASLLNQWDEELRRSSEPGTMQITVWHGQNRLDLDAAVDDSGDSDKVIKVVITSYGVLSSEHAKVIKNNETSCPVFKSSSRFVD